MCTLPTYRVSVVAQDDVLDDRGLSVVRVLVGYERGEPVAKVQLGRASVVVSGSSSSQPETTIRRKTSPRTGGSG